jgi:hypothetical protein
MGAYANPQEIEGQQDPGAYSKPLQKMFDTITAGAMNASDNITKIKLAQSERILQENKERATKNSALLKELNEGEQNINVLVAKGKALAPKGLDYDCYDGAADRWRTLQTKIDLGGGTPEDKREIAKILASVDGFAKGAANTSGMIEKVKVSNNNIGDGAYDEDGSDPNMLRALIGLEKKDGNVLQPGFQKMDDGNGNWIDDYSQPGYTVFKWDETVNGETKTNPETFISTTELEKSLNGGGGGGIIFKKSFESDNEKVRKAYQATENGGGIFEYKNDVYTNKVTPTYLTGSYTKSTQVGGQTAGTVTRQPMRLINKEKILEDVKTAVESVSTASASNPKEAASRYFNYVLPVTKEENPNKEAYNNLPEYAKFKKMPTDFSYKSVININDKEGLIKIINDNSKAAFVQSIPNSQAYGNPITISDKELAWEKDTNKKIPAEYVALLKDAESKGSDHVIKSMKLADGKVRNVLIAKEKDGKVFLEIVGYNTNQ